MIVWARAENGHRGSFEAFNEKFVCALGAGGVAKQKREGDLKSPAGQFPLREVLYRADRLDRPSTGLPLRPIRPSDGWCDAPSDNAYNRPVALPYHASAENLWREDNIYDLVVVIGYNDKPVRKCLGSAIFLHIATHEYGPTKGCVALAYDDLLAIVRRLDACAEILIGGPVSG
jgi:L,D-peptidoglycan transpeptidase YkuD (ErfK/YbiS/YcfS/YnhG family)